MTAAVVVYQTRPGLRWHFGHQVRWGLASTCCSWDLANAATRPAMDVPVRERCTGKGCRERWAELEIRP